MSISLKGQRPRVPSETSAGPQPWRGGNANGASKSSTATRSARPAWPWRRGGRPRNRHMENPRDCEIKRIFSLIHSNYTPRPGVPPFLRIYQPSTDISISTFIILYTCIYQQHEGCIRGFIQGFFRSSFRVLGVVLGVLYGFFRVSLGFLQGFFRVSLQGSLGSRVLGFGVQV